MSFPPEFLNELRDRLAVSEIVGRRVRLQRKGREFQGLCPFHNEKTPSFTVNDDKGFYHCFGCGAHGDVITFAMNTEALSFPEAIEKLAQMAGLQVPVQHPEERARDQKRRTLEEVMEAACRWYERNLRLPVGKQAMEYLKGRGLDEATLKRFRLGYAPNERSALKAHLVAEGFEEALIIEGGLHKPAEEASDRPGERARGAIDYFRDRVIFPITDRRGRVIGFGGRVMGDGQPKYLNSPETPLFHKGQVLYGLAQAREAAGKAGSVLVTEGYMDVIGLAMGGFDYAVAPLGTALTEEQILQLWKLAPEPVLCFDGDSAGQRAAARAAERALSLLKPGYSLRFVTLPAKEDPDSLIRKQGPAAMRRLIDEAAPMVTALWRIEQAKLQNETPEQLALLRQTLEEHAAKIADRTVQGFYRAALLRQMDEAYPALAELMGEATPTPAAGVRPAGDADLGGYRQGYGDGYEDGHLQGYRRGWRDRPSGKYNPRARRREPETQADLAAKHIERTGSRRFAFALRSRRSEQILLAALINHPALIDEFSEAVSLLPFADAELDRLREEILHVPASVSDLDVPHVESHLIAQGYSTALERLRSPEVEETARFIGASASADRARSVLQELLSRASAQAELEAQLAEAQAALAGEMTEENWTRMESLRQALQELVTGPDFGDQAFADVSAGSRNGGRGSGQQS
ncbi:DNA primase [Oceanibaculum indicum]|uniref:DNA primase n=1 Tax=Oceanibaculum indicum TaxID=526216 RepID=A0A420WAN5_9PROT|nr:DNA primase [Oceanibaculum indicum]RKQ68074.1 DNA primase [Oceanibaculum indicum]